MAGLTGGGSRLRPGEISLATRGVLYLDELTEFRRDALEALRQPLEEGRITIVRVHASATLPAAFVLVASMNPCRCGYHGSPDGRCECTPNEVRRYRSKISGPLLDRFDLVVDVPAVDPKLLGRRREGEPSRAVQARVVAARRRQSARLDSVPGVAANAQMTPALLERFAPLGPASRRLLVAACERLGLSARAFDRVRRVARTVADLDGAADIEPRHVAEVLRYRAGVGK
jgi:magnesium chelatase family protein